MSPSARSIGLTAATAIVLGNIVGVMIFFTPSQIARHLPWDGWFLAVWAIGGGIALLGAFCVAELGAMLPEAGGDYIFIREAYGEPLSFLAGWTSAAITFPGSIAAMAVGLCHFQGAELLGPIVDEAALQLDLLGCSHAVTWAQLMALGVICALTLINHLGVRLAGRLQISLIASPVILVGVAGLVALGVEPSGPTPPPAVSSDGNPWSGLLPALIPVFFAYSGWNVITYIGGEIRDPGRNIPRSLVLGTSLAVGLYLLTSWIFLRGVPAAAMPGVSFVPALACNRLFGEWTVLLITAVIGLAVLSSLNSTVLAGARVSSAMAGRGLTLPALQRLSPRFETPFAALWVQAALAALAVLSGRFEQLVACVVVVMLLSSCLAVGAVVVLRLRRPAAARPYRAWGYPITPAIYVVFSLVIVASMLIEESSRAEALWGLVITALGLPLLWWTRRRRRDGFEPWQRHQGLRAHLDSCGGASAASSVHEIPSSHEAGFATPHLFSQQYDRWR